MKELDLAEGPVIPSAETPGKQSDTNKIAGQNGSQDSDAKSNPVPGFTGRAVPIPSAPSSVKTAQITGPPISYDGGSERSIPKNIRASTSADRQEGTAASTAFVPKKVISLSSLEQSLLLESEDKGRLQITLKPEIDGESKSDQPPSNAANVEQGALAAPAPGTLEESRERGLRFVECSKVPSGKIPDHPIRDNKFATTIHISASHIAGGGIQNNTHSDRGIRSNGVADYRTSRCLPWRRLIQNTDAGGGEPGSDKPGDGVSDHGIPIGVPLHTFPAKPSPVHKKCQRN